ncbi:restriction endonuclease subunit S [Effusibacillus lacus]|uniref:Type I restriction modification DNA specificity domain-containing protein n=1 Tax=Effusibacillus lacus TaxID=1348429 RepID=A0A292YKJ0_9BACL|nr:restriction endonuclease subunit S [Effusibacillus lacus]TCS70772.1 type I restriction enzyme S subunit [Effusibacillus lacus]GAX89431.1 hypothetical protein EFBL_1049 [Effusibacillus lacus]
MSFSEWREVKLGDVCESVSITHSFEKSELIFLNTSDVYDGSILHNNYSPVADMPGQAKKSIKRGDILYSEIRPKNKRYAMVNFDASDYVVSTKFMVIRSKDLIDNKFLYLYLTSNEVLDTLQQVAEARSGTFPQITFSQVAELNVNLPPLPEQKAISATLSALDDMIELNNQINKILEEMAQAIFKSWFVDFEPFKDGEFEESELGLIPKGWRVGTLGDICHINMGQSPSSDTYNSVGVGMVFYQGVKDFGFKYPEESMYCSKPNKIAKPGDVLLSVRAPVGQINVAYKECCIGRGVSALRLKHHKNNILYYWLKTITKQFHDASNGSIFDAINKSGIERVKVVVPSDVDIIDIFNDFIKLIDEELFNNFQSTRVLKSLRDTLLPKLMSGEIRVPVEEVV